MSDTKIKYQLCKIDEYGHSSIIEDDLDYQKLMNRARRIVHNENMNNALAYDEKMNNLNAFLVDFFDDEGNLITNAIYGGREDKGQDAIYLIPENEDPEEIEEVRVEDADVNARMFLGIEGYDEQNATSDADLDGDEFTYAKALYHRDNKTVEDFIDDLHHDQVKEKELYYIKPVLA